jgi:superfamily II DNA or RNA helicase
VVKLRPYQNELIHNLRTNIKAGSNRVVLCAPTGSGKTVIFSYLAARHLERGGKILIFTHRSELQKQANNSFTSFGLQPEKIQAGKKPDLSKSLHVAMIETMARRIKKPEYLEFLHSRTMIICDEAHIEVFDKLYSLISHKTVVIGCTATPYRKGKTARGLDEFYTGLVQGVDTPDLIKLGYLSPAKSYGVELDLSKTKRKGSDFDTKDLFEKNRTFEGVVQNWARLAKGSKTLLFASNVESSRKVCDEFNAHGYHAKHLDGTTSKKDRDNILEWFDTNPKAILCNCGVLTAGFDQPDIGTVILYRATTSLPLFLQMVGRGSRIYPGKKHFNILDFGMNISRLGFWENPRIWGLKKADSKTNKEGAAPVRICKSCGAINPASAVTCVGCGVTFPKKEQPKEIAFLEEMNSQDRYREALSMTAKEQANLCKTKSINARELLHRMNNKRAALEFVKAMGYKGGWLFMNRKYFKILQ